MILVLQVFTLFAIGILLRGSAVRAVKNTGVEQRKKVSKELRAHEGGK